MKCNKVEGMLSDYLDNSLKEAYRDEIKEHLAKCGKCTDELNTMIKLDNLLKLKVKEKPSKEYWENYWKKLESKLDKTATSGLFENRKPFNLFIPRFAFVLNGILIAVLIFLSGLLYINTQQIKELQFAQEEMQQQICTSLFHLSTRRNVTANVQIPSEIVPMLHQDVRLPNSDLFFTPLENNSLTERTGQILDRYRCGMIYSKFTIKKEG